MPPTNSLSGLMLLGVIAIGASWGLHRSVVPPAGARGPSVSRALTPADPPAKAAVLPVDRYLEVILDRNLFDASRIGREPAGPAPTGSEALVLLGTVPAQPSHHSLALLSTPDEGFGVRTVGVGDRVGNCVVADVRETEVLLDCEDDGPTVLAVDLYGRTARL